MRKLGVLLTITLFSAAIASAGIKQKHSYQLIGAKVPVLMALSADGKTLAVVSKDGRTITIFDAGTGKSETQDVNNEVTNLAFSPDGAMLAVATKANAFTWDISRGVKKLLDIHVVPTAIAFSSKSALAIATTDRRIIIWDIDGSKEVNAWQLGRVITRLALSVNSKYGPVCAAAAEGDSIVEVFDISGKPINKFDVKDKVTNLAFSPNHDSIELVVVAGAKVGLWNVEIGYCYDLQAFGVSTNNLVFAPVCAEGLFFAATEKSDSDTVQVYFTNLKEDKVDDSCQIHHVPKPCASCMGNECQIHHVPKPCASCMGNECQIHHMPKPCASCMGNECQIHHMPKPCHMCHDQ